MDAGGGGGGERAMPKLDEFVGTRIALAGRSEDFLGFHIEEAQPHGPVPHDAFQVSRAAAGTEALLGIQRYYGVAELPDAIAAGISPEADPVAQVPDSDHLLAHAAHGSESAGE